MQAAAFEIIHIQDCALSTSSRKQGWNAYDACTRMIGASSTKVCPAHHPSAVVHTLDITS